MPKFRCEHCRQKIAAPDTHVGRRVRCPRCKQAVRVPAAEVVAGEPALVDPMIGAPPSSAPADPIGSTPAESSPQSRPRPIRVTPVPIEPPEESPPQAALQPRRGVLTARAEQDFSSVFGDWMARESAAAPSEKPPAASPPPSKGSSAAPSTPVEEPSTPTPPPNEATSNDFPAADAGFGDVLFGAIPPDEAPATDPRPGDEPRAEVSADDPPELAGYEHFPIGPDVPDAPEPPIPAWEQPFPPAFEPEIEPVPESQAQTVRQRAEAIEPSEVIDTPRPSRRPAMNSAAELEDLLRHLEPQAQGQVVDRPARRTRIRQPTAGNPTAIRVLGAVSLVVGLAAIALTLLPSALRYAAPVGSGGVILALAGLVMAVGRRSGGVGLPIGGATVSAIGVTCAVLGAYGLLPLSAHPPVIGGGATPSVNVPATPLAGPTPVVDPYVPATSPLVVDQIQVRVASALVLQPAVYTGDYSSLHTLPQLRLQITLDLKAVGDRRITYRPWRRSDDDGPQVKLTDPAGQDLILESLSPRPNIPVTAPIGALAQPTIVAPHGGAISDVLLFDPPPGPPQDLKLDLPGANIGAPRAILHIRIPAAMIRVQ